MGRQVASDYALQIQLSLKVARQSYEKLLRRREELAARARMHIDVKVEILGGGDSD